MGASLSIPTTAYIVPSCQDSTTRNGQIKVSVPLSICSFCGSVYLWTHED